MKHHRSEMPERHSFMKTPQSHVAALSFVIPVYNEQETIVQLCNHIFDVMKRENISAYEIIFIDDGSIDHSWLRMQELYAQNPSHITAIRLRKNFGKSAALRVGFQQAAGEIVFTLDADLQDDPEEIPNFLEKLAEGVDLVSGWKLERQDPLSKTLPSRLFNAITSRITGIRLHDFNCGFKAYRREVLECIDLYGELHRYIPVLADEFGFKIGEIPVRHHPRRHGISKYGFERYARGFLDLLTAIAVTRYFQRPAHLFGSLGIISGLFGSLSLSYLIVLWFLGYRPIGDRPLLLFGILAAILSVQLVSFGVLAELFLKERRLPDTDRLVKQVMVNKK